MIRSSIKENFTNDYRKKITIFHEKITKLGDNSPAMRKSIIESITRRIIDSYSIEEWLSFTNQLRKDLKLMGWMNVDV